MGADGVQVVLELELADAGATLEDVHIRFPAQPSARPYISRCDGGEAAYDSAMQQVHWHIPLLSSNEASAQLEFLAAADAESLQPFTLEGVRRGTTKCPVEVVECYHQER